MNVYPKWSYTLPAPLLTTKRYQSINATRVKYLAISSQGGKQPSQLKTKFPYLRVICVCLEQLGLYLPQQPLMVSKLEVKHHIAEL